MGRIKVDIGWVLVMSGLYYLDETGLFFLFVMALFAHEIGHILVLKALNVPIFQFHLSVSGGALETATMSYGQEILVAMAGPTVNLALACTGNPRFCAVNLGLAVFNLLPIFPLDGGRMLQAWLLWKTNAGVAKWVMFAVQWLTAMVLAGAAVYWGLMLQGGLWPFLLLFFLGIRIASVNFAENRL